MTPQRVQTWLAANGLDGWRGVVAPMEETGDWAAAIYSPDYRPGVKRQGEMVAERGPDATGALSAAAATARRRLGQAVTQ